MRIVSVHLKNIKSHRDKEFTFSPGINVLSGVNGSGKSTIFEAVGYALFGVNAQDFVSRAERFLTIGAKKGEVAVVFVPADGERYRVTRTVGPSAKWLLAKETGGLFEVEEHANAEETEKRIASLLGLSENRPLADQFKLVIGPFQNDFLGPFVIKQPTKRQAAFDEILGIDAWRKTFDGTKSLAGAIQAKMDTLEAEISGKVEQVAVLPAKELELRALRESLALKQKELEQRQREQVDVTARLAALDAQKERIEAVQGEVQGGEGKIVSGKEYVSNQQLLVEQAKAAAAVVAAASAGKRAYDGAEQRLKVLREQEKQKLLLEKKLTDLEKEQSTIRAALAVETRELDELRKSLASEEKRLREEEGALVVELAELKKAQADAEQVLARARDAHSAFAELAVHKIENVLPYLFTSLDRMAAIDVHAAERQKVLEGSTALEAEARKLEDLQQGLEKIQGERSELLGRKQSLIEGRQKIGAGDCPYFHEPCKNVQAGGGVEIFNSRIERLESETERLDAAAKQLAAQLASAQAASHQLAGHEQVRLELSKSAQERAAVEQDFSRNFSQIEPESVIGGVAAWLDSTALAEGYVRKLKQELKGMRLLLAGTPQERRALLSQWSDGWRGIVLQIQETLDARIGEAQAPVQASALKLAELNTRRQALDARKRDMATAGDKVLQREKTVGTHQGRLQAVLGDSESQKAALAAFAGVEDAIKAAGEEIERNQGDRDRYIAHQKAAEELEKRQETLSRYQGRLQELEAQLAARREELGKLVAVYAPQDHDSAKAERDRLMSSVATLKAELGGITDGIKRLEGEIALLAAVAEEIEKKRAAIEELKERGTLVKFLRNQVFKNVSAQLSERFREEISSRADRIYRSISDSDEELLWGENYQIVLKDMADGAIRERTDDQLSGGQMMSAVVALRLALLQTIGARIAFFDEPTSNLDAERRENLAKAFRSIDVGKEEVTEHWYDQLFLVSHDVSFTEITDQMIHLD